MKNVTVGIDSLAVYLDSAPVVYFIEDTGRLTDDLVDHLSTGGPGLVVSDLTRMECRVHPIRHANPDLVEEFDAFFRTVRMVNISTDTVDLATEFRAHYRYSTPDALHLAAAVTSGCDIFLTNDRQLTSFDDITVELID